MWNLDCSVWNQEWLLSKLKEVRKSLSPWECVNDLGLQQKSRINLMLHDEKTLKALMYSQSSSQDFNMPLRRSRISLIYSGRPQFHNTCSWKSVEAAHSRYTIAWINRYVWKSASIPISGTGLRDSCLLPPRTAQYHEQVNYTSAWGILWRWRYWHQASGLSDNANIRQDLTSYKHKKEVSSHSHTQEQWIGLMSDGSMTKGNIS